MRFSRKNFKNSTEQLTLIFLITFSILLLLIWINGEKENHNVFILIGNIWIGYGIWNYFGYSPRVIIDEQGIQFKSHVKNIKINWDKIRTLRVIEHKSDLLKTGSIDVTDNIPERGNIWVLVSTKLVVDLKRTNFINTDEQILFQYRQNAF